jgi:hypothetical protein
VSVHAPEYLGVRQRFLSGYSRTPQVKFVDGRLVVEEESLVNNVARYEHIKTAMAYPFYMHVVLFIVAHCVNR